MINTLQEVSDYKFYDIQIEGLLNVRSLYYKTMFVIYGNVFLYSRSKET